MSNHAVDSQVGLLPPRGAQPDSTHDDLMQKVTQSPSTHDPSKVAQSPTTHHPSSSPPRPAKEETNQAIHSPEALQVRKEFAKMIEHLSQNWVALMDCSTSYTNGMLDAINKWVQNKEDELDSKLAHNLNLRVSFLTCSKMTPLPLS